MRGLAREKFPCRNADFITDGDAYVAGLQLQSSFEAAPEISANWDSVMNFTAYRRSGRSVLHGRISAQSDFGTAFVFCARMTARQDDRVAAYGHQDHTRFPRQTQKIPGLLKHIGIHGF
jgi:hypothetical protein